MAKKKDKSKDKVKDKPKAKKKVKKDKVLQAEVEASVSEETKEKKPKKKKKVEAAPPEKAAPKKKKKKAEKVKAEEVASDEQKEKPAKKKKKSAPLKKKKSEARKKTEKERRVEKPAKKKEEEAPAEPVDATVVETKPPVAKEKTDTSAVGSDLLLGISQVYRLSTGDLQTALKDNEISASQWEILSSLSQDEPLTQQELARSLFVSEGNITQMLTKMEKLGWIERKREWRTNYVTLSAAGHALKESVQSIYTSVNDQFFGELTKEERDVLQRILDSLVPESEPEN